MRIDACISNRFPISCRVKQGSVLSLTLFLIVMDRLIHLRESNHSASVSDVHIWVQPYHADNLRTSVPSIECVALQDEVINQFSAETSLKLNLEKFEVVKISANQPGRPVYYPYWQRHIHNQECKMSWNPRLTAKDSVYENINKSR